MQQRFTGTLTSANIKQHIPISFDLPTGLTSVDVHFEYSPGRVPGGLNMLTLTIFDSEGFRGAGHRHAPITDGLARHDVTIGPGPVTPGYRRGNIPGGRWAVFIDTHSILPDSPVTYTLEIEGNNDTLDIPRRAINPTKPLATARQQAGWYRGDLHGHTIHSDARWDIPEFLAFMRHYKLDFATLSDHNTVSGLEQWDQLTTADFLTMGGLELTTFYGHCLALGLRRWVDWQVRPGERTMEMIADEVTASGGLFIIAHPTSVGDPICTGCDWTYRDMMPGNGRVVEIWNTEWEGESNNEDALQLWYSWLNKGFRMAATVGTDIHRPYPEDAEVGFNVIYAEALSEHAILHAVRQGHLYVSAGPALELTGVAASGAKAMMGDALPKEDAEIQIHWRDCIGSERLVIIADGKPLAELPSIGSQGQHTVKIPANGAHWCVAEIRDTRNHLRAVTNPIFFGASDFR